MNTKSKLKKYNITHKDIAKSFGYSSEVSFNNSHKKEVILNGIASMIEIVEERIRSLI